MATAKACKKVQDTWGGEVAMDQVKLSDRVYELRQRYLNWKGRVGYETALYWTQGYQESEGEPVIMSMQEFTRIKNFIDGEWIEEKGTEYIPLYNPSTGEAIGEVPLSSDKTSLAAVDSAYEAYGSWRKLSVSKRVGFLFDMRQAMIDNEEKLAVSIAIDQAKHISEARGEIRRVIEIIEASCSIPTLKQWWTGCPRRHGRTRSAGRCRPWRRGR